MPIYYLYPLLVTPSKKKQLLLNPLHHTKPIQTPFTTHGHDDMNLVTSMAKRLAKLETQVRGLKIDLAKKDHEIENYQDEIKSLTVAGGGGGGGSTQSKRHDNFDIVQGYYETLEAKCKRLETQVKEMEAFLQSYNLVWKTNKPTATATTNSISVTHTTTEPDFTFDFNVLVARIQELNVATGYGIAKVQPDTSHSGAHRLKVPEALKLRVYKNGIYFRNGPFRSFDSMDVRLFITDLLDGYLPLELREEFPDGSKYYCYV